MRRSKVDARRQDISESTRINDVQDETCPHNRFALLKLYFPSVQARSCGDEDGRPSEPQPDVGVSVYLFEEFWSR